MLRRDYSARMQRVMCTADIQADNTDNILHAGHPALRDASQFVDKPGELDPAWAEPASR